MAHSQLAIIAVCALAPAAQATLLTMQFAGQITSVEDPSGVLEGQVQAGSPYSGSFSFESSIPDALPGDPGTGSYLFPAPGISGTVGSVLLDGAASSDNSITMTDATELDQLYLVSRDVSIPGLDLIILNVEVLLTDTTGAALSSDALPLSTSDVAGLEDRFFGVTGVSSSLDTFKFSGPIDLLTIVPEPTAFVLALTILTGGAAGRKSQHRHHP